MDAEAIEAVLRSLQQYRWGWRAALSNVAFIGKPVELRVDTQPIPVAELSPPLDATEAALARLILANLPVLLPVVEQEYRSHADSPDIIERIDEPHIWLSRDVLAEKGPQRWSFVVGIAGAPDWCIQADFDGLAFQEIWSGD